MKYLKLFASHSDYNTAKNSLDKPNISHCIEENEVHYNPFSWADEYLTFVAREDGTFQLSRNAVRYSLDNGKTWTELAAGTASPTITAGNKIMWKGELTPSSIYGIGTFSATGKFDVQGNIMSLLFYNNFKEQTNLTGKTYAFYQLFKNNTNVVNAKNLSLPATTLAENCYSNMFYGCTSLTTAPQLPATTLANYCYKEMFRGCTALTITSELPATTLAKSCYDNMFRDCTNLIIAPELPAITLADYCYVYMFDGCTSLTTAPELPATSLASNCYYCMFYKCTSLVNAPVLPATTLVDYCYAYMFGYCTALTTAPVLPVTTLADYCYMAMFQSCTSLETAPILPAITLAKGCYSGMFNGCSNLNYIKAMFTTTPSTTYTSKWVTGVTSTGTFVKNSTAQWDVTGDNGIPTGWTVQTA